MAQYISGRIPNLSSYSFEVTDGMRVSGLAMVEINSALIGGVRVAMLGGLGWIVKRYISGEKSREVAALYSNYASIASTMKVQGLNMEDVEAVANLINIKKRKERSTEVQPSKINEDADISQSVPGYWTQSAMNARAIAAYNLAQAQLDASLTELYTIISEDELEALSDAQVYWENLRDKQSKFASNQVAGGSLEPLIYNSEMESITLKRIAEINAYVNDRKQTEGL